MKFDLITNRAGNTLAICDHDVNRSAQQVTEQYAAEYAIDMGFSMMPPAH